MSAIVVFDFGGVLFDWNPSYLYESLLPDPAEREWFLREVCNPAWNIEQDRGRTIAEAVALKSAEYPAYAAQIAAFYARWPETLRGLLPEGMALFDALRAAGYPVFGLTNWSAETFPYAWEHYPFLHTLPDIVVSGREGLIKPDPAIYHLMYQRILRHHPAAKPADLYFIDDSAANAAGASAVGWHGIHHTSAANTAAILRAEGLIF
ncbi:HAD-IA family hydrolase [Chitinibacter tainanensis]|uniref:HAD-IA family hydrolase n=1 Tax=Chitinibacter tainanensis TaxID=230667 RepID=UPI00041C1460|nr:HAD-IA family hydrolase [Chitinibacter tainanensis]